MNNSFREIPGISFRDSDCFLLMAGPCVVENRDITRHTAEKLVQLSEKFRIPFIFKASYRKANRSKSDSFTGIGDIKALEILAEIRKDYSIPVVTDIHNPEEAAMAAAYVDVLQIPAFLCRQTDLLHAAAITGKWVNIKKGQFLSGSSMNFAVEKVRASGNKNIMLTDRGNTFGYHDLVVDFRNIPEMQRNDVPVIMDITHSLQQPNQGSGVTGGRPDMIETIGKAAIAVGADGIFIETHPDPSLAKSDGANMLKLSGMENLLAKLAAIRRTIVTFK
ncbi:MAG: 3-deoxy-8-phosphooctulonate synthase [Bacteroidales bacterium]